MATSTHCELMKLNVDNCPAWKLQARMALIRDDLWEIVSGSEKAPEEAATADAQKKFKLRSNKALSMIVLSMKPELHYHIGREPEDSVAVWKLLANHFERKTWGNCYELWKRLMSMPRMKEVRDGGSIDKHLKSMQETFDSLAVLEDPVSEKKQVMFILASLPESFQTMVTALAASTEDVPSLADVKEKLRSEELKQKQAGPGHEDDQGKAVAAGHGNSRKCRLEKVLYLPNLSYNLLSVSKAAETGHTTSFSSTSCEIVDQKRRVTAFATKVGSLYYLEYCRKENTSRNDDSKERLRHRRYGHVGEQNLQKLAKDEMLQQFDYDTNKRVGFCESCVGEKMHRSPFEQSRRHTTGPLELVHSDVCGKMEEKSRGGAEYFLTFVDHHTRYAWVYPLRTKDQVFGRFVQWKALVEKSIGKKIKTLRTDNGGEVYIYTI